MKAMKSSLGSAQEKLASFNSKLLRVRSLHRWDDPRRTRLWLAGTAFGLLLLLLSPPRLLLCGLLLDQFTTPLQKNKKYVGSTDRRTDRPKDRVLIVRMKIMK